MRIEFVGASGAILCLSSEQGQKWQPAEVVVVVTVAQKKTSEFGRNKP